jgi:hypothetical protein
MPATNDKVSFIAGIFFKLFSLQNKNGGFMLKEFRFTVPSVLHSAIRVDAILSDQPNQSLVARAILDFIEHGWSAAADEVPACATARGDRVVVAVMSPTDFQRVSDFAARRGLRRSAIGRVALAKRYANVDLPESLAAVTAGWPR